MPTKKPAKTNQILSAFKKVGARVETKARVKLKNKQDFALFYTPGVGVVSTHLAAHPEDARTYSVKRNSVAVISDGSAVLGLGNIGPYGALPVMEGKALIFKELANIDAWPIVLNTQDTDEIVNAILAIASGWGGINLEDFSAPRCFEIERRLIEALDIPVMHDDQHGTAIVVLAGLINAAKVVKKNFKKLRVVISGAGAAGVAITKLLIAAGIEDIIVADRAGVVNEGRTDLSDVKRELAEITNPRAVSGDLMDALIEADALIGVSGPGIITKDHVKMMADDAIVFGLANPVPEIMPDDARAAGARVIATGRSDFPNQLNNSLVFPGVFRGALDKGITKITTETKLRAAKALAALVPNPTANKIIPDNLDKRVVPAVARSVR
ncbi:MAG: NADP-dependent malic enzyme [Candidatus Pacebacteria bacterium]|nr:NADP-dependent malic enzyme [Candidatus Paceibacterota bacterium]